MTGNGNGNCPHCIAGFIILIDDSWGLYQDCINCGYQENVIIRMWEDPHRGYLRLLAAIYNSNRTEGRRILAAAYKELRWTPTSSPMTW